MAGDVLKVELHSHTADDPADRIPYSTRELIDRAAALGYDALAITLHDAQLDLTPHFDHAASRGLMLIPGIERTIDGKHVLLINFDRRDSEAVHSFDDLAALRRSGNGLVIAPHPFFPDRTCLGRRLDEHAELFDAVEWNGMFLRGINFNARAARWAQAHGKPMVGNGDVHRLAMLGTTYSLVDAQRDPGAICRAIRAGAVRVEARPHSVLTAARIMASLLLTPDKVRSTNPLWIRHSPPSSTTS